MIVSRLSLAICIAVMLALSGCATVSQPVYKVPENNSCTEDGVKDSLCKKFDGIPYLLPQTILKVSIPVIATTETEGSFVSEARDIYAVSGNCTWDKNEKKEPCKKEDFYNELHKNACIKKVYDNADELGVKIAATNPNEDAKLIYPIIEYKLSNASIASEAEPDPDQLYFVEVKGGMFERRSVDITFAAGGILNEITASTEDKTAEFVAKTFGSVLGAAAKFGSPSRMEKTDARKAKAKTDCEGKPISKYKNLVYRALDTLKYIGDFPNIRNNELRGNFNTAAQGKDNLEFRLKELDAGYGSALAVFEGNKTSKMKTYEITLLPKPKDSEVHFAKFSVSCGLYRTDQPSASVPSTNIPLVDKEFDKKCEGAKIIKANLTTPPHLKNGTPLSTRISNSLDSGTNIRGIYYRVPETSRITIKSDADELLVKDVAIAQFGKIASLPAETGSSNVTYKVTLDPATGMLLKVNISSEAANTGIAKDFIDPVGDYLKARKDSKDELTQLQREEAILKTKKSIQDLKDAMAK